MKIIVIVGALGALVLVGLGAAALMSDAPSTEAAAEKKIAEERVVANATAQLMDKVTSGEAVIATVSESDSSGNMKQKTVVMSKDSLITVKYADGSPSDELDPMSAYHIVKMHGPDKISNFAEVMANPAVRRVKLTYDAEVFAEAERQRVISDASLAGLKNVVGTPVTEPPVVQPEIEAAPAQFEEVPQARPIVQRDVPVDVVIEGHVKRAPPAIPDPMGLGERLVLIETLVEHFKIPRRGLVLDEVTYNDLVAIYWKAVRSSGKPAPYPEAR